MIHVEDGVGVRPTYHNPPAFKEHLIRLDRKYEDNQTPKTFFYFAILGSPNAELQRPQSKREVGLMEALSWHCAIQSWDNISIYEGWSCK